ncbi:hypothetical protein [Streptomyces sp. NPDC056399]|uniref:hypothetical protein n=1 Tax=Streptomyces sp. NPDC056399 TaxID=3345807 RepID=UPI0035D89293
MRFELRGIPQGQLAVVVGCFADGRQPLLAPLQMSELDSEIIEGHGEVTQVAARIGSGQLTIESDSLIGERGLVPPRAEEMT